MFQWALRSVAHRARNGMSLVGLSNRRAPSARRANEGGAWGRARTRVAPGVGRVECGREDSNLHPRRDRDLNPARLPVPPRPLAVAIRHWSPEVASAKAYSCPIAAHLSSPYQTAPEAWELAAGSER